MGVNTRPFVTVQRAVAIGYPALGIAWLAGVAAIAGSERGTKTGRSDKGAASASEVAAAGRLRG